MNFPVLNFFAVAPLLYLGIWLIAQESLLGSERLANYMKGVTSPGRGKDSTRTGNFEYLTLVTTILLLVLLAILVIALNYVKTPLFVLITICTLAAWLQKKKLKDQQDAWQGRLDSELPGLIQMLTLMIASGISPLRAIELIALDTKSELSSELLQILERIRQGDSSSQALDAFARRVNTLDARRFSNAISMALERGSPLIPVLSALVGDARNEEKVRLLRRVGKAEIALMVPVVFLLLPISVLFALFPSFMGLQMF